MTRLFFKIKNDKTGILLEKGFTLIELIISIAIVGILSIIIIVSSKSIRSNASLKSAQADISARIKKTQDYALKTKGQAETIVCGYGFRFINSNRSYEIFYNQLNGAYPNCEKQNQVSSFRLYRVDSQQASEFDLPADVTLISTPIEIFFTLPHANMYGDAGNSFVTGGVSLQSSEQTTSILINSQADITEN